MMEQIRYTLEIQEDGMPHQLHRDILIIHRMRWSPSVSRPGAVLITTKDTVLRCGRRGSQLHGHHRLLSIIQNLMTMTTLLLMPGLGNDVLCPVTYLNR